MNYYNEIKQELIDNEINRKVKSYAINKSDLNAYYNVGRILSAAGKHYGEGIIKKYSQQLKIELGKSYSVRLLYRMIKYYNFITSGNLPTVSANLSWSHYDELLKLDNTNKIAYYINICEKQSLSVRQLREKIKNKEYERLPRDSKDKLVKNESHVVDFIKNPILIKNRYHYTNISERLLQKLVLEDIESFMKELGNSFSFIGSEYKIKLSNRYNYIDLLLFNYEYNCFIVVELKITELKKEDIGQIQVYMHYIDDNLKRINQDKTIGIIICKKDNQYIMEYCSDDRILAKEYELV